MRPLLCSLPAIACLALLAAPASAHFQEIIPSADVLPDGGEVSIEMVFTHPFEGGPVMEMKKPVEMGVFKAGTTTDLLPQIKQSSVNGKTSWSLDAQLGEPGASIFYVEPQPYWEPAEGKYIIHYAKVVVDNYASGEGWDELVGLPVEIQPLTRPTRLVDGQCLFRRSAKGWKSCTVRGNRG